MPSILESRAVLDLPMACPAGMSIGETLAGSGCLCRIEGGVLTTGADPSSLLAFCTSPDGYQECPTWRDAKQRDIDRRESLARPA